MEEITTLKAATQFSSKFGGKIWNKKDGETRVYLGKGYVRFSPEDPTGGVASGQICWFTKSYETTQEMFDWVEAFNNSHKIVDGTTQQEKTLWQEDEDGIVGPVGWHEPGVHIVREWYQ